MYTERRRPSSQWHNRRAAERRPWKFKLFLFVMLVFSGTGGWFYYFSEFRLFPINSVVIQGDYDRIDQQAIKEVLVSSLEQSNFLTINTGKMREQLSQIPWVAVASVSREWPAKLVIHLKEYDVVARWNDKHFMEADGKTFSVKDEQAYRHLPLLYGPEGQQQLVWQYYNKINQELIPTGLKVVRLSLSPRQAWQVKLNNGVILVLGRTDTLTKIQRVAKVYPKIIGSRSDEVEYVDLRYANAIAVRWKKNDFIQNMIRGNDEENI